MNTSALVPVEQRTIDFYGDELIAMRTENGTSWTTMTIHRGDDQRLAHV